MSSPTDFDAAYLQQCIDRDIALAVPMGIIVESADDEAVVLRAPLAPNANHHGSAFGGSLYSLAVLSGWLWVTRYLLRQGLSATAVIQRSTTEYLSPVLGELHARARGPQTAHLAKFQRMLERAGRGRIVLHADVQHAGCLAMRFEGVFVAALRR